MAGTAPETCARRAACDLLARHPELPATSFAVAAACADVESVRRHLANDPSLAARASEPYGWQPLLYQAYARHDPRVGTDATLETARLLLGGWRGPERGQVLARIAEAENGAQRCARIRRRRFR